MFKTLSNITKNWFKLRGQEYSCNLRFFKEHQIVYVQSGHIVSFNSALEPYKFKEVNVLRNTNKIEGYELDKLIEQIHKDLLNGKFGDGEFIN